MALSLAVLLCSCKQMGKQTAEADTYTIGVVTKSKDSEYWLSVCAGMEKAAKEANIELIILSPDTEVDKKVQKQMIADLLKMDIDALAVSPIDSNDNQDYIAVADKQGIPVFAYDTQIEDAEVPYIGIDNRKAGYELAKVTSEILGHKGHIAVVSGDIEQACHAQRVKGIVEYMSTQPDIQIDVIKTGYSNLQVSEEDTEKLLKEYPELNGIMTTSAVTALGLAEAVGNQGIMIASVDEQEDAIAGVKDGRIAALVNQSGTEIGYETVRYIVNARDHVKQEKEKIIETKVLTRENIDEIEKAP